MNEQLLNKTKYYVIGVSGGCDSMYLLDTLRKAGYHLLVAHVNYNYRHDSYIDYELVCDYCATYGIPFYYKEFHSQDYHDGNFQDQARSLRYDFYKEIYDLYKCDGLILGHHLDDHLETIYMQLSKHNVIHYLGIKEESYVQDMRVVRPLMDCYKEDILQACKIRQIPYHDDYTNFEIDFERDKVRNTVLNRYTKEQKEALLKRAQKHNQRIKELEFKVQPYYQQYISDGQIYYYYIPKDLRDMFLYLILRDVMHPQLISQSLIAEIKHQINSVKQKDIVMNLKNLFLLAVNIFIC